MAGAVCLCRQCVGRLTVRALIPDPDPGPCGAVKQRMPNRQVRSCPGDLMDARAGRDLFAAPMPLEGVIPTRRRAGAYLM